MSEQITQRGKDPDELFKFIKSASSKALEMMGEIIWSVKPENDKPEMMFNRMRQYTSDILEPAGIDFTFQIDDRSLKTNIPLNYRKDLFMFFKEALNNMAKYSRTDTAEIIIQSDRSELILIIKDHGEGFDTEKNYSGNGLKNMRARAMAMRTIFRISSEKGIGCTIELILKIKKL
jgi:signal transduction histidine kinase